MKNRKKLLIILLIALFVLPFGVQAKCDIRIHHKKSPRASGPIVSYLEKVQSWDGVAVGQTILYNKKFKSGTTSPTDPRVPGLNGVLTYYYSNKYKDNIAIVCGSGWEENSPQDNACYEYKPSGTDGDNYDPYVLGQIVYEIALKDTGKEYFAYNYTAFTNNNEYLTKYYKTLLAVNYYNELYVNTDNGANTEDNNSWVRRTQYAKNQRWYNDSEIYGKDYAKNLMKTLEIKSIVETALDKGENIKNEKIDTRLIPSVIEQSDIKKGEYTFVGATKATKCTCLKNCTSCSIPEGKEKIVISGIGNTDPISIQLENGTYKDGNFKYYGYKYSPENYKKQKSDAKMQDMVLLQVRKEALKPVTKTISIHEDIKPLSCEQVFDDYKAEVSTDTMNNRIDLFFALKDYEAHIDKREGTVTVNGKKYKYVDIESNLEYRNFLNLNIKDATEACETYTPPKPSVECFVYTKLNEFSEYNLSNYETYDVNKNFYITEEEFVGNYLEVSNKAGTIFTRHINYSNPDKTDLAGYIISNKKKYNYNAQDNNEKITNESNTTYTTISINNKAGFLIGGESIGLAEKLTDGTANFYYPNVNVNGVSIGRGLASVENLEEGDYSFVFEVDVDVNGKGTDSEKYSAPCPFHIYDDVKKSKDDFEFRIIDTNNPFPDRKTGSNWCYKNNCSNEDNSTVTNFITKAKNSYDNGEPQYKIILTSSDIKQIRNFNKSNTYDVVYEGGNEFVEVLRNGSGTINDVTINLSNKLEINQTSNKLLDLNGDGIYGDSKDLASAYQFAATYGEYNLKTSLLDYNFVDSMNQIYIIPSKAFQEVNDSFQKIGDINNDSKINMKDLLLLKEYLLGTSIDDKSSSITVYMIRSKMAEIPSACDDEDIDCDLDDDDKISMTDVLKLRKAEISFPIDSDYVNAGVCDPEKVKELNYTSKTNGNTAEDFCFYADLNGDGMLNDRDVNIFRLIMADIYLNPSNSKEFNIIGKNGFLK